MNWLGLKRTLGCELLVAKFAFDPNSALFSSTDSGICDKILPEYIGCMKRALEMVDVEPSRIMFTSGAFDEPSIVERFNGDVLCR